MPEWCFGTPDEADFEPLLAIRIDVMRAHLERVFRYSAERAREYFRQAFDEPGLRTIRIGDELVGCVGFRPGARELKIDSFYLAAPHQNRGLGTVILDALLVEADTIGLPIRLEVLRGSPARRFYERRGFVKIGEDDIEAEYERPVPSPGAA